MTDGAAHAGRRSQHTLLQMKFISRPNGFDPLGWAGIINKDPHTFGGVNHAKETNLSYACSLLLDLENPTLQHFTLQNVPRIDYLNTTKIEYLFTITHLYFFLTLDKCLNVNVVERFFPHTQRKNTLPLYTSGIHFVRDISKISWHIQQRK